MAITNSQQARQMYKQGDFVMQGGVKNYLGKQKTVSNVPVKWKSGSNKPATELAYITEAEKNLLLKEDIHGSLKDGPNEGPEGIMSLDSQGDMGGSEDKGTNEDGSNNPGGDGRERQIQKNATSFSYTPSQFGTLSDPKEKKDYFTQSYVGPSIFGGTGYRDTVVPNTTQYGNKSRLGSLIMSGLGALAGIPGLSLLANLGPFNNKAFFDTKVMPAGKFKGTNYEDYMSQRQAGLIDAYGNPISQDDGDNNNLTAAQLLALQQAAAQQSNTTDPVVDDPDPAIPYRLMNMGGDTEDAPLIAGAPELKLQGDVQPKQENMMMAEADPFLMEEYEKYVFDMEEMGLQPMTFEEFRREAMSGMAGGGIAELRQGYIFGGIAKAAKKAVKGATRAVKKIAKSKLGRAALLYAGTAGLGSLGAGGGFGSLFKLNTFAPATVKANLGTSFARLMGGKLMADPTGLFAEGQLPGKQNFLQNLFSGMSTGKKAALGIGALSALPLLGIGTEEEEEGEQDRGEGLDIAGIRRNPYLAMQRSGNPYRLMAEGGNAEPVAKDVMPLLDMNGKEKDYRETGGFVDMGRMEKADDVPARLSKNEFVFTADAVRNAGEGDIDKGAEVMYNMMKNLESGGEVSEESQGLQGARAMFQTSQKLEGVM